ncbi:MAG: hypothetical protein EDM05_57445 [Leptolyngbya sp. IPPAS B-1204]|nr:hypothetical protein [Leptolyngbya sp. NK1-12]
MTTNSMDQNQRVTKQPMSPEEVDPRQKAEQKKELEKKGNQLTINPGDRIDESKSLQEKAQQVAVDAPDITGEHIVVPTYFVFNMPDGSQKALHHVKDADEISDMIRLARLDENGNRVWW